VTLAPHAPGVVGLFPGWVLIGPHFLSIFNEKRPIADFLAALEKLLMMVSVGLESTSQLGATEGYKLDMRRTNFFVLRSVQGSLSAFSGRPYCLRAVAEKLAGFESYPASSSSPSRKSPNKVCCLGLATLTRERDAGLNPNSVRNARIWSSAV
jgi:hypothetical protein